MDIVADGPFSLGELSRVLREEEALRRVLGTRGRGPRWLANEGAHALEELSRYRNPAAHSDAVPLTDALRLRDHWLGVGCHATWSNSWPAVLETRARYQVATIASVLLKSSPVNNSGSPRLAASE